MTVSATGSWEAFSDVNRMEYNMACAVGKLTGKWTGLLTVLLLISSTILASSTEASSHAELLSAFERAGELDDILAGRHVALTA